MAKSSHRARARLERKIQKLSAMAGATPGAAASEVHDYCTALYATAGQIARDEKHSAFAKCLGIEKSLSTERWAFIGPLMKRTSKVSPKIRSKHTIALEYVANLGAPSKDLTGTLAEFGGFNGAGKMMADIRRK